MNKVTPMALPACALLQAYRRTPAAGHDDAYTDCYAIDVSGAFTLADFVFAFYTAPVFRLERMILRLVVNKPSTDREAQQVARGDIDAFAAWTVEKRSDRQLLMCDFQQRTRSWFMVEPLAGSGASCTRLYFGSAVVPVANPSSGRRRLGAAFHMLLGFHKLYSRVLLRTAQRRLRKRSA